MHTSMCSLDGAKELMQIRRCKVHANHALQELMQITRCRGSYGLGAAGAHADQALSEFMQKNGCECNRRCARIMANSDALWIPKSMW